ncbi:MAG TPA: hypothetical protein VFI91_12950 [Longimicrobiaceae bacterium]|nr:hypothetical protein [Longimicrobiaceae bacterium]
MKNRSDEKEQGISGDRGAEASRTRGTPKQPAQASGRRPAEHEKGPKEQHGLEPDHAPSRQGDGDPG